MRAFLRLLGCLLLALPSCQVAPRQPGRKEALRANALPNKRALTESPTQEHAAPTLPPRP